MPLTTGTRIGPYEVVATLGAGGMGEVYRARDGRLGRDVAIKVLPDLFSLDPDRLARFEREAHLLASLQHPKIAVVYGVEEMRGQRALVMELVEGETLADRVARGALLVDEALAIAGQIAEALEAAHEKGIVHRRTSSCGRTAKSKSSISVWRRPSAPLARAGRTTRMRWA
jgi:serine/threonine protein kinase